MAELKDKVLIYSSLFAQVEERRLKAQFRSIGYSSRGISKVISTLVNEGWLEKVGEETGSLNLRSLANFEPEWDGRFRLVLFDVPEEHRNIRDSVRNYIKKLGAGQWQRSVWVLWRPLSDVFWNKLNSEGWDRYVYVVETVHIFGVKNAVQFATRVWGLDDLNRRYATILDSWQEGYTENQNEPEKLGALANKLTGEYLNVAIEDPFLPKDLLFSDWFGDEARKLISSLEKVKVGANNK